jgi:hypothetical protein
MKRIFYAALSVAFIASPAFALKVTNLDTVAHYVELSGRGQPEVRLIQPNATERFMGASQGFLALVDAPDAPKTAPKKGKKNAVKPAHDSVVHADGILAGIIGTTRTSRIPADPDNSYTIWPGGKIFVQGRMKTSRSR